MKKAIEFLFELLKAEVLLLTIVASVVIVLIVNFFFKIRLAVAILAGVDPEEVVDTVMTDIESKLDLGLKRNKFLVSLAFWPIKVV